ncbi:MAG: hypothetical protein IJ099_01720 [Alphaproteobacteria bacterium]|nr:hypothetical protein [Alphaproteobacteria bacterium]
MNKTNDKMQENSAENIEKLQAYRLAIAKGKQDEQTIKESKRWHAVLLLMLVLLLCAVLIYGAKLIQMALHHIESQKLLNQTTAEISQLVENIRNFYVLHNQDEKITENLLQKVELIPPSMLQKGQIINPYGGRVIVATSLPMKTDKNTLFETFKISLQGLPHEACVALSQISWGSAEQGLQAVALGHVDANDNDKAFTDIDKQYKKTEIIEVQDKDGQWQRIALPPQYEQNVAKPKAGEVTPLFTESEAFFNCSCGNERRCSFALQYAF